MVTEIFKFNALITVTTSSLKSLPEYSKAEKNLIYCNSSITSEF